MLKDQPPAVRKASTATPVPTCPPGQCPYQSCHCTPWDEDPTYDQPAGECESSHLHCVWVCVPQGTAGAMCAVAEPTDREPASF